MALLLPLKPLNPQPRRMVSSLGRLEVPQPTGAKSQINSRLSQATRSFEPAGSEKLPASLNPNDPANDLRFRRAPPRGFSEVRAAARPNRLVIRTSRQD
jgi:hypothetical protein